MEKEKEWFDYDSIDLKDTEKCKEVFFKMIQRIENKGECREVFHILAYALFNDEMR